MVAYILVLSLKEKNMGKVYIKGLMENYMRVDGI